MAQQGLTREAHIVGLFTHLRQTKGTYFHCVPQLGIYTLLERDLSHITRSTDSFTNRHAWMFYTLLVQFVRTLTLLYFVFLAMAQALLDLHVSDREYDK